MFLEGKIEFGKLAMVVCDYFLLLG